MKRTGFFWVYGWLITNTLIAQPIIITRLDVIPKRSVLSRPVHITPRQPGRHLQHVTLTYQQNDFLIYFRAPGLPPPYAFQLKNYTRYEVRTANNYALFTNLPSNDYEFIVRSLVRPDSSPARLYIHIESPIWSRWWFLPLLFFYGLLLVSVLLYFLYRYRLRQFLRIHAVRENIARDLHDDMGSYLSSISMLSQSVLNIAQKDPKHARLLVDKIGATARQVMDSMSDIIWSVNPDNDSMSQIVVRMRDVATDLLGDQDSSLHMDVDEKVSQTHLPLEQRRDFFLIYKEALTNIAKYASASHVWIRLQRNGPTLVLTMQDDGVGFVTTQSVGRNPLGGNGLKNIRARAEKLGGTLTIQSEPGQGTVITLQISVS